MAINIKNLPTVVDPNKEDYAIIEQTAGTKKVTIDELTKTGTVVHCGENADVITLQKPEMVEKVNNMENNISTLSIKATEIDSKIDTKVSEITSQLDTKTNFCNTLIELKTSNKIKKGMTINTLGYYSINDSGNAEYYITDMSDSSVYQETLSNGLYATLINREINPYMLGCKCDGVTDDTTNFQKFLDLFSTKKYRLISNSGIIYITSPVYLKGVFASEEEVYQLNFINTKIKYIGDNSYGIYVYGHKNSKIKGLSLTNDSNGFIGITSCWYSEFIDIQCKELKFNANYVDIPNYPTNYAYDINTIKISDSRIKNLEFFNVGYSNSITFENCIFLSNSNYDYVCTFDGQTYNNIKFLNCDLSYSNKAIFNLTTVNTGGTILLQGCYLDNNIPLCNQYNGWTINQIYNFEASNTSHEPTVDIESFSKTIKLGSRTRNSNRINTVFKNLSNNGTLWNLNTSGTSLYGTTIGTNASYEILDKSNACNGKALNLILNNGGEATYFYGQKAQMKGIYSAYIRFTIKEMPTEGNLNIGLNNQFFNAPLDGLLLDNEIVISISSPTSIDIETPLTLTVHVNGTSSRVVLQIYEYGILFGNNVVLGCDLSNPLLKYCNSTNRPTPTSNMIGFNLFDTTLNKRINWTGTKWVDSQGIGI